MKEKKRILFVCRNFNNMAGGVERMSALIMNQMVNRGYSVCLVTWDLIGAKSHYHLDSSIKWECLNLGDSEKPASWWLRLRRQIALRKIAKEFKPNVAIGFQVGTFIAARLAMVGLKIPVIAAERNSPDLFDFIDKSSWRRGLSNLALTMADTITIQLESYRNKYSIILRDRIRTIHNPVFLLKQPSYPNEASPQHLRILNVGRLSFQKNQIFLINAFSLIANLHPEWILTLVGDGEKRQEIELLVLKLGLSNRVEIIGAVIDVEAWYQKSAFLAFPSLWEGFPNALVEAFSYGLPAVGLKGTAGVNELLVDGKSGVLSDNDVGRYSLALQYMIENVEFRRYAGRMARESVIEYDPVKIFNQWDELFSALGNKKQP